MFCSIFPPSQLTCCCHENAFYCLWTFDFSVVPCLTSFIMWVTQYSDGHSICTKFQCLKCAQRLSAQVVRNAHHPHLVLGTFLNVRFCTVYCIYISIYIYMPVMCIMNKPAFDTLMLQADLLWNTFPSDTSL